MAKIKAEGVYFNDDRWIVKLPYSAGGQHRGRKITYKTAKGLQDLIKKINMFIKNPDVLGYIPYALIQPRICCNSEAKVRNVKFDIHPS
jgi:hypothetical protein